LATKDFVDAHWGAKRLRRYQLELITLARRKALQDLMRSVKCIDVNSQAKNAAADLGEDTGPYFVGWLPPQDDNAATRGPPLPAPASPAPDPVAERTALINRWAADDPAAVAQIDTILASIGHTSTTVYAAALAQTSVEYKDFERQAAALEARAARLLQDLERRRAVGVHIGRAPSRGFIDVTP
jgi:hypothetical protein